MECWICRHTTQTLTARQAPAGSTDMNHTLFSDQASASRFHLEYIKTVFYPGVSLSIQTFGFIPPFCSHIKHTQTHSSRTDTLRTLRCVSRTPQLYSGTLRNAEGDTWEFANMSFLPCFLGVHCERLNLLHGKTPNAEAKERPQPLIRLSVREQALTERKRLKDRARIMWEMPEVLNLWVYHWICGNVEVYKLCTTLQF